LILTARRARCWRWALIAAARGAPEVLGAGSIDAEHREALLRDTARPLTISQLLAATLGGELRLTIAK